MWRQERVFRMPKFSRNFCNGVNSPSQLDWTLFILPSNWVSLSCLKLKKVGYATSLDLGRYNQMNQDWPSINKIKHLGPVWETTEDGLYGSVWINSNGLDAQESDKGKGNLWLFAYWQELRN